MPTISNSKLTDGQPDVVDDEMQIDNWLVKNGLPEDSFINLGMLPNKDLHDQITSADMVVFPYRCEPGTNLVAMEAMIMGLLTVLVVNTGQLNLIKDGNCYPLYDQTPMEPYSPYNQVEDWQEPTVEETLERMEEIYAERDEKQNGAVIRQ